VADIGQVSDDESESTKRVHKVDDAVVATHRVKYRISTRAGMIGKGIRARKNFS
jgi:hypothetical protein